MPTHYLGKTDDGRTISRKSTRSDFTHAATTRDTATSRLPSFGTSAEGARRNFYTNHRDTVACVVVPVSIVTPAEYREALKAAKAA